MYIRRDSNPGLLYATSVLLSVLRISSTWAVTNNSL